MAVNGFDETMAYGGEDREFGVRLVNLGVKPKHVRYNAIVIHLDHKRGYVDPAIVKANKQHRIQVDQQGITQTAHGISSHIKTDPTGAHS